MLEGGEYKPGRRSYSAGRLAVAHAVCVPSVFQHPRGAATNACHVSTRHWRCGCVRHVFVVVTCLAEEFIERCPESTGRIVGHERVQCRIDR